ncbi:MAG: hypothetical protein U0412_13635 [Nitrospira sp.]
MKLCTVTTAVGLIILTGCASYDRAMTSWDGWIGTSKDSRVKDLGIPTRCHVFKAGGEACEWPIRWTPESAGTLTLQFDAKSQVCEWTYRDPYGDRRSQSQCS